VLNEGAVSAVVVVAAKASGAYGSTTRHSHGYFARSTSISCSECHESLLFVCGVCSGSRVTTTLPASQLEGATETAVANYNQLKRYARKRLRDPVEASRDQEVNAAAWQQEQ
jgi:hypothetical protein